MKQSQSRHNIFSKVDHDKAFIDTNYRGPKVDSTKELPALQLNIRSKLASKQLSAKFQSKTAVTTVATGLGKDADAQLGAEDTSLFEDDNASMRSNLSYELENAKKSPELIKIEDFMDELGKAGHVGEHDDDDESYNSEDEYGEFVEQDRSKFTSTLDVHKKFMMKAHKKNTLANVKAVANLKIMSHKKKMNASAPDNSIFTSTQNSMKNTNSAVGASSTGSLLGLVTPTKSFMFLSKLSNGTPSKNNTSGFSSPASPASQSPQVTSHKVLDANTPVPYMASPGGYAYSSKHNLLHEAPADASPDGKLALFGKAQKQKQLAHRAFSASTLSTLHAKYDTTHSVLSATKTAGGQVKSAASAPAMYGLGAEAPELYHVPILNSGMTCVLLDFCAQWGLRWYFALKSILSLSRKYADLQYHCPTEFHVSVHGKKTMLSQLDKMFHSLTAQPAMVIPKPEPPPPAEPMTLQSLLGDQLLRANIPANKRISDQALNTLINATPSPANYGPRVVQETSSAAAIVAQLDRALQQQKREENEQKARYEKIAASYAASPTSPEPSYFEPSLDETAYSMATFVSRLDQAGDNSAHKTPIKEDLHSPPKLDFTKLGVASPPPQPKPKPNNDPYSIDVHALKLPDINSPQTQAYYKSQKQPILCIYSPAPLDSRTPVISPERGNPSPTSSPPHNTASPLQLHGTITTTAGGHAASSPAIMYIASPDLAQRKGLAPTQSTHSLHNRSSASLPIVSSSHAASYHNLNNHLNHQYQTQAEYQQALHPQTQQFLQNMLHSTDPDFHDDPRNYRGRADSMLSSNSVAELENSIYDYEQEFDDLNATPVGDSGKTELNTESNRFLLPANTVQQGGNALLDLGYQYQHSTNTYVHKDERNRSKFGQYERAPLSDPYAADFSDRHLEAILDTTVGHGAPVIFIPPGAPAAEPIVEKKKVSAFQQLTNRFKSPSAGASPAGSVAPSTPNTSTPHTANVNARPKHALEAGEVLQDSDYRGVRTKMQHPRDTPLNAIHYRGGAGGGVNLEVDSDEEDFDHNNFREPYHGIQHAQQSGAQSVLSADNSTLHSHHPSSSNIKQEINDYIAMLASHPSTHQMPGAHANPNPHNSSSNPNHNDSVYSYTEDADGSTVYTDNRAAERARVKLWDKLNNRYAGDREGEFVRKNQIKEYIYEGVGQDTRIMREYMEEMDEGWNI